MTYWFNDLDKGDLARRFSAFSIELKDSLGELCSYISDTTLLTKLSEHLIYGDSDAHLYVLLGVRGASQFYVSISDCKDELLMDCALRGIDPIA